MRRWSPEIWVRAYFNYESTIAVPAVNPIAASWRAYDSTCSHCHYSQHQPRQRQRGQEPVEVCGACGAPWGYTDCWEPKGLFDRAFRPHLAEDRLYPWCDVGRILSHLYEGRVTRWPTRIFLVRALSGDSLREIAREAAVRYTRSKVLWNKERVAQLIDAGRSLVASRLVQAGLLDADAGGGQGYASKSLYGVAPKSYPGS